MPYQMLRRLCAGLLALLFFVAAGPAALAQNLDVVDEIVAIVGDDIILKSDVDGFAFGVTQQQGVPYTEQLWMDALNELIDQRVLTIQAERDTTIEVTDNQIDQALNDRIEQITRQVGSTARLEEIYGKSLVQLRVDLREEFRDRLLAEQIQQRKLRQIKITPTEVERWFNRFPTDSLPTIPETVRLAHIVRYPKISEAAKQDARDIATAIRDSVASGTSTLEEMARRFSDDPGSASSGGSYEDMRLGDLVPEFGAMASRLEPGVISEPFETDFGYHVLRVDERVGETIDFTHVLISVDRSQADPTEAIANLSAIRDSLVVRNLPFELMARRNSEEEISSRIGGRVIDPSSGERDLVLEALGPTWQVTIDTLEVGEISHPTPVDLLSGERAYHIVKLQQKVPEHRVDIETDYTRIEQLALQDKRAREMRKWLDILREDVYIDLRGKAKPLSENATSSTEDLTIRRN